MSCPAYPVIYMVLLQEVNSNSSILGPSKEPRFILNSANIKENSKYSFIIRALNSINISSDIAEQDFCKFLTSLIVNV